MQIQSYFIALASLGLCLAITPSCLAGTHPDLVNSFVQRPIWGQEFAAPASSSGPSDLLLDNHHHAPAKAEFVQFFPSDRRYFHSRFPFFMMKGFNRPTPAPFMQWQRDPWQHRFERPIRGPFRPRIP